MSERPGDLSNGYKEISPVHLGTQKTAPHVLFWDTQGLPVSKDSNSNTPQWLRGFWIPSISISVNQWLRLCFRIFRQGLPTSQGNLFYSDSFWQSEKACSVEWHLASLSVLDGHYSSGHWNQGFVALQLIPQEGKSVVPSFFMQLVGNHIPLSMPSTPAWYFFHHCVCEINYLI